MALEGDDHLQSVRWRNRQTEQTEKHKINHVFIMTGAAPNTSWLNGWVALDAEGFIKTGSDLSPEIRTAAHWSLARTPYLLETSLPGVFAVGDVRGGSIKRVASTVGEGSIAISFVHKVPPRIGTDRTCPFLKLNHHIHSLYEKSIIERQYISHFIPNHHNGSNYLNRSISRTCCNFTDTNEIFYFSTPNYY